MLVVKYFFREAVLPRSLLRPGATAPLSDPPVSNATAAIVEGYRARHLSSTEQCLGGQAIVWVDAAITPVISTTSLALVLCRRLDAVLPAKR